MGLRLLPFRQYDENDVVNLFALTNDAVLTNTTDDGSGSNGVFVTISDGNFDQDVITYGTNSYLGKTDYPFVASEMYPTNPLELTPAVSGDTPFGITLNQTAKNDENGEKLLYNPTKKEELQAVLPGQSVPVATKGIFTFSSNAFNGDVATYTIGGTVRIDGSTPGTLVKGEGKLGANTSGDFGVVVGTGSRNGGSGIVPSTADQFSGEYLILKI